MALSFDPKRSVRKKDGHQRIVLVEKFSDDGVGWKFVAAVADDQTRFTPYPIDVDGVPVAIDPRVADNSWHIEILRENDIENVFPEPFRIVAA